jgi:kynureninase
MTDEAADPLSAYRAEFPALARSVYLVSHSLGAMPRAASEALAEFARLWTDDGIRAWSQWLPMVGEAGDRVGQLMGASPGSVTMVPNVSTAQSILASCFDYSGRRNKIVYGALEFPTVSYVWKAEERRGARVTIVPADDDGIGLATERMCAAIDDETLIVPLSHVLFRSSYIQDIAAITRRAHQVGARGPAARSAAVAEELNRRRFLCDHRPGSGIRASPHFYTTDDEIDAFIAETSTIALAHVSMGPGGS